MDIQKPKGMNDVLPCDVYKWRYIEGKFTEIANRFGYKEIRTPVFEYTELFSRGVGETTDVVQKEMYTFTDKGDRSVTLRPEGTASAVRAYLENGIYAASPIAKLFYIIGCYRHEKPQAGRLREFHQLGIEAYGAQSASVDAEVITLAMSFLDELKVSDIGLFINSIGCPNCRKEYNEVLRAYLKENEETLCDTCKERMEKNPLRVLDCKSSICQSVAQSAPKLSDYLCDECKEHFEKLKAYLDAVGIKYTIDEGLVRGLDYYTKTVFEIKVLDESVGPQRTICGGGRYDGLIETLGGKPTPGVGFGMGIERLLLLMEKQNVPVPKEKQVDIFIAVQGEAADLYAQRLVFDFRRDGVIAERELIGRSIKAQMKYADKIGARFTIVLGQDEIDSGIISVRDMQTHENIVSPLPTLVANMRKYFGLHRDVE